MNAVLEPINSAGKAFVEFAGPMLIQSSVLILILLLIDVLLRKKVRAVLRYWMWMLVLVKLFLPTSLSLPMSFGYWFGDKLVYAPAEQAVEKPPPVETTTTTAPLLNDLDIRPVPSMPASSVAEPVLEQAEAIAPPARPAEPVAPLSWQGAAFLTWLVIAAAMALLLLQRALFVRGLVAQAKAANRRMNDILKFCREDMRISTKVDLKVSANATSPAVCGLFRPVILVPENLALRLNSDQLRTVLLHELAHIKRGDLWVNLVQTFLQIMYFYNPLLWLANAIIRRVREQAVDEAVLVAMGQKAQQYPQTLVDVARLAFKRPALSLRLIGVVESKSALKGRIKHILNRPIPRTAKLGVLGLAMITVAAIVLLPMAKAVDQSQFEAEGGPVDIRLLAVVPDGSDTMYDVQGRKLDTRLRPIDVWESPWGSENQRRDFVFEVPETGEQLLFDRLHRVSPCGTDWDFSLPGVKSLGQENGRTLFVCPTALLRTYPKRTLYFFRREVPMRKVDITLRYFYGPPQDSICTFTGPFEEGQKTPADGNVPCELSITQLDRPHFKTCRCRLSCDLKLPHDSAVLIYDTAGERHLVATSPRSVFYTYQLTLEEIAAVTIGEKPHERTFRNVVIGYPDRPNREYPEYLDRMADALSLEHLRKEKLARYQFRDPNEAIAVIDIIRGRWLTMRAVEALLFSKPRINISRLDQRTQDKIHRTAEDWANALDVRMRARGIQLGLLGGWPEFLQPALQMLSVNYEYVPGRKIGNLRAELGRIVVILSNWYREQLSAEQLKHFKKFRNGKRDLPILSSVNMGAAKEPTFREILPDGVTVELVGICEHPSEGKQWWRPDGSVLREKPYGTIKGDRVYFGANETAYEFVVRVAGPTDVDVKWKTAPEGGSRMTSFPHGDDGRLLPDLRVLITKFHKSTASALLRIGVAPEVPNKDVVQDYQWVEFKNVSLRPGHKTDVEIEAKNPAVQGEFGKSAAQAVQKPRRIHLSDVDARNKPNVLDLATGQTFTIPDDLRKDAQAISDYFEERAIGDLWFTDGDIIGTLGGGTIQLWDGHKSTPFSYARDHPGSARSYSLRENSLSIPCRLLVTDRNGRKYDVRVLELTPHDGGIEIEYTPIDRTGVRADYQGSGSTLEFRIAPDTASKDLSTEELEHYREDLAENGPSASKRRKDEFVWFPVRANTNMPPVGITGKHEGKKYVLLHNRQPYVMTPEQGWALTSVEADTDAMGRLAVHFAFDGEGAELFYKLTKANLNKALAAVIDGQVVSAPTIMSAIRGEGIITGRFTKQEVDKMIQALRKGMSPVPRKQQDEKERQNAESNAPAANSID